MNFLELAKLRYSVRSYKNAPIEEAKMNYIMECVRMAPSAVNFQPWKFRIVNDAAGLEALNRPCDVKLYSDSKYVVDAFNQNWIGGWLKKGWKRGKNEPVKNVDLWKRLLEAKEPHNVTFIWVKGHDGHPQNERCDELATSAADAMR